MYIIKLEVPNDQDQGTHLISLIESWRNNPNLTKIILDRRYFIYKEIVQNDNVKIGITNFNFILQTENETVVKLLQNDFKGIVQ